MRKRKGALLRISIEIETTKKSLFYLLAQSVSVYPTSNVGTLVSVTISRNCEIGVDFAQIQLGSNQAVISMS
jgi:hypothetical protein